MNKEYIGTLLQLYFSDEATHQQREMLFSELEKNGTEADWEDLLLSLANNVTEDQHYDPKYWRTAVDAILRPGAKVVTMHPKPRRLMWIPAAAVVLLVAVTSWYLFFANRGSRPTVAQQPVAVSTDVPPGQYKAKLTLADGKTIILDSAAAGPLATQGGAVVINTDGKLVYEAGKVSAGGGGLEGAEVLYNTLSTTKGETYSTVLADGTRVWLNASSSIKFPVVFTRNERRVEITGEAFFEVKHNAKRPFITIANGVEIWDLGTEFNINAYGDEAIIKTTLVSGSVRVVKKANAQTIAPGQQLQITGTGMKLIKDADVDLAVAWKNGFTSFRNADIRTIMRQVERWYDIDVHYEGSIPDRRFRADIPRSANLSEVLLLLKANDIHYRLEGRKLTIIP